LDDDADLLDAGAVELDQVIVKQRARDAVRSDDGKQFLLARV
jgi:hypothetical protein